MQETTLVKSAQSEIVEITKTAIEHTHEQVSALKRFVEEQLQESIDYGKIPGCGPKPVLLKPGAEKLLRLFGLGARIISKSENIDWDKKRAIFCYQVEVFNLKTGQQIAQCEAYSSNQERKYHSQDMGNILNTLSKMCQKRALVGAVLIATHASDFFTADIEDMDVDAAKPTAPTLPKQTTQAYAPDITDFHQPGHTKGYEERHEKHMQELATLPQKKKLYAMTMEAGMSVQEAKEFIFDVLGRHATSDELTKKEIQVLFLHLDEILNPPPPKGASSFDPNDFTHDELVGK